MKKTIFTAIIMFILVMFFVSCKGEVPEETEIPESSSEPSIETSSSIEEPEESEHISPEHLAYLREDFPTIDGSTSLIPLEAGIRSVIFGKTMEEATRDVEHTTTWGSFRNLLSGDVDMIFSCPLSEEQKEQAAQQGVTLEAVPVAYEGFVFVVNADNPVDELTQDELRKIYSGEITNWKEVGGNDAEIIAYQRNNDSGSQNYMIDFMGEVPLVDAPKEKRPGSMAGLMDVLAINDNAENAIGYSVYAYAADMYGNGDEIKFIKVDGAEVSKNSMAKGEYPLMGYNYAVFQKNKPEDSPVRKLVEWMVSDEGQLAVANAGYVTIRDMGFDYTEASVDKFEATGTGMKKPEGGLPSYEYTVYRLGSDYSIYQKGRMKILYGNGTYIEGVGNKKLLDEINAFITEKYDEISEYEPELKEYLKRRNGGEEYGTYHQKFFYPRENMQKGLPVTIEAAAKNGYIYVMVSLEYWYDVQDGYEHYYKTESAVWELESGKRLDVSDLFYEGTDVDEVLNRYISEKSQEKIDPYYSYEMKADFASLPKEGWSITPEGIYLDYGNPYFAEGVFLDFENLPEGILVTEQPDDMYDDFINGTVKIVKSFRLINHKWDYRYLNEGVTSYALLPEDSYPTAKKINAEFDKYLKNCYTKEAIEKYAEDSGIEIDNINDVLWFSDWWATDYGGKYIVFNGGTVDFFETRDGVQYYLDIIYPYSGDVIFDIETGERIEHLEILSESGKKKISEKEKTGLVFDHISFKFGMKAFFDTGSEIKLAPEDIIW